MMKKAAKQAIGVAIGCTLGGAVLPRLLMPQIYNGTWPPLLQYTITSFLVCYAGSFAVFLLIGWLSEKRSRKNDGEERPPV